MKKFHLAYAHFMLINFFLQINWIRCSFIDSDAIDLHEENNRIHDSKKIVLFFVCLCLKVYMLTIELLSSVSFSFMILSSCLF